MTKPRKMPARWTVEVIPGGYRVDDAEGKALAYCFGLPPSTLPAAGEASRVEHRQIVGVAEGLGPAPTN